MHFVELGFRCNNACVFCAQGRLREHAETPRSGALEKLVDAVRPGDAVAFVGGEPTLVEALPALVARARERGARAILVQTNGRRLAVPGYAEALADAGATALDVSLCGANAAMHDYHTSVPDSFRQTVAGLRRARGVKLAFATTTVVTRSNFRHLVEVVRVAHALGARAVRFQLAQAAGVAARNADRVVPSWPMTRPHLVRALGLAQQLGLECIAPELGVAGRGAVEEWFAGLGTIEPSPRLDSESCPSAAAFLSGALPDLHAAHRAHAGPDRPTAGPSH